MLKRLLVVFGNPEVEDPNGYLTEVARVLKNYHEGVQDEACDELMKSHRGRIFPTPAQCRTACETIIERRGQADQRKPIPIMNPEWSKQAIAKADSLIRCNLGQRAADEGWVLGLHDFCRKKGRLPINHEISVIMANAKEFDEAYRVAQETPGSLGAAMVKLGTAMLSRRDRCARVADGEVLP